MRRRARRWEWEEGVSARLGRGGRRHIPEEVGGPLLVEELLVLAVLPVVVSDVADPPEEPEGRQVGEGLEGADVHGWIAERGEGG